MSLHTYRAGLDVAALDAPFYALIQAAMRQADTDNEHKLRAAWPEVWADLAARYSAPGGILEGDQTT